MFKRDAHLTGEKEGSPIVVIKDNNATGYIIMRVYRMAGETVDWYNIPRGWSLHDGEYKVPEGKIYVLGDNREVSEDSRSFGPVDLSKVIGKAVSFPR